MLKQSLSRNQRSKGFKIKHFLQVCLLLAICIWLLNQVKHSYEKKQAYKEGRGAINEVQHEPESIKLGRKGLHPRVEETTSEIRRREGIGAVDEEVEESISEDNEDEGRGGGDDEIDGRDQEKAEEEESEEVEDLIDEEDKEKEEESDEQEDEMMGNEDQTHNEGKRNSREAREEHYKGDDASSAVVQHTQTINTGFQIGGLRKVKEKGIESAENIESAGQENENYGTKEDIVDVNDSGLKVKNSVTTKYGAVGSAVHSEEKGNYFNLANSDVGTYSNSPTTAEANENTEVDENSRSMLRGTSGSPNGKIFLSKSVHDVNVSSTGRDTFLPAAVMEPDGSSKGTKENERSHFNITLSTRTELDAARRGWMIGNTSESVVPTWINNFNATGVTQKSFAFTTVTKTSGQENDEESSASLATSHDLDAVRDESFDSSDSSFYQEDRKDQAVVETLPGIEIEANNSEVAVE